MKRVNIKYSLFLMTGSILLLLLLQTWWLRIEYQTAAESFERETDLVFRSTIKQITDSAMYDSFRDFSKMLDSSDVSSFRGFPTISISRDSIQKKADIKFEAIEVRASVDDADSPSAVRISKRTAEGKSDGKDSLRIYSMGDRKGPRDFRFLFDFGIDQFNSDSLKKLYQLNLPKHFKELDINIVSEEKAMPLFFIETDSLAFTTSFYRLGQVNLYAAEFPNAKNFVLRSMIPQLGFSIFLTALVILSFWVVYSNQSAQEKLLKQKNEFIANITHELKTPVATVGVALEAIKNFDALSDPEKTKKYLEMAQLEVQRLNSITDKILKTSIFDLQKEISTQKQPIELDRIIEEVEKHSQLSLIQADMVLEIKQEEKIQLMGHADHLREMLLNIVENSIKYAHMGKSIMINVSKESEKAVIEIIDHGPGIADVYIDKVTEKFYRLPTNDVHNVKGYGLGLSYANAVVKSHGGKLIFSNMPQGGLKVKVILPYG